VKKGLPFRDAHEAVAHAVKTCAARQCDLADLNLDELRAACNLGQQAQLIDADVKDCLTLEGSIAGRQHVGGTAPQQVLRAIAEYRKSL